MGGWINEWVNREMNGWMEERREGEQWMAMISPSLWVKPSPGDRTALVKE